MARIRTIKPEFFTSEDITSLSPLARLFYVSLWCEADREGRLSWRVKTLKQRYLPADDCDIDDLSGELINSGLIELYEVDGCQYAEIISFKNHQVINNRESPSRIPARVKVACTHVQGEGRKEGREGKGKERKGIVGNARGSRLPNDFEMPDEWGEWCETERPDLRPMEVFAQFRDYWVSATGAKASKADWFATWRNWCRSQKKVAGQSEPQWRIDQRKRTLEAVPSIAEGGSSHNDFFSSEAINVAATRLDR